MSQAKLDSGEGVSIVSRRAGLMTGLLSKWLLSHLSGGPSRRALRFAIIFAGLALTDMVPASACSDKHHKHPAPTAALPAQTPIARTLPSLGKVVTEATVMPPPASQPAPKQN